MNWIIAGLGNPDQKYVGTRHNVGRDFLMALGKDLPKKAKIITPDVYMNNSGGPLRKLVTSKKAAEKLVVLHDELDLPLGSIRIRKRGGSAGHNGMQSIIGALGTQEILRVRLGLAPERRILKPFTKEQLAVVDEVLDRTADAVKVILAEGPDAAMNRFNRKPEPPEE